MAEILGAVASGIAIAQITGTAGGAVLKLKKLWSEVKNVPETITDLMEQIDCLDPALWEAEQQFSQTQLPPQLWNDVAAVRSAECCRKALAKLSEVVLNLSLKIKAQGRVKRGFSRAKVALKEDELDSLQRRLGIAARMLQSAQMGYIITLVKLQPNIIALKVASQLESSHRPLTLDKVGQDEEERNGNQHKRTRDRADTENQAVTLRRANGNPMKRWKRPPILGRWRVEATSDGVDKSYAGWKLHLRGYYVRPSGSPVFQAAKYGRVDELQAMFAGGKASPFDRDEDGWGVCCIGVAVETFNYLLQLGLDVDGLDRFGRYVPQAETPLRTRIKRLCYLARFVSLSITQRWVFALSPDWERDPYAVCNFFDEQVPPLIHMVVDAVVVECTDASYGRRGLGEDATDGWFSFAIQVIQSTQDLHILGRQNGYNPCKLTALVLLLVRASTENEETQAHGHMEDMLRTWLRLLNDAGVDLALYGHREKQLLRTNSDILRNFRSGHCSVRNPSSWLPGKSLIATERSLVSRSDPKLRTGVRHQIPTEKPGPAHRTASTSAGSAGITWRNYRMWRVDEGGDERPTPIIFRWHQITPPCLAYLQPPPSHYCQTHRDQVPTTVKMKWLIAGAFALAAPVHAGLRFQCSTLTIQRLDPVVQPGAVPAAHVHHIVGGNAFNATTMLGDVSSRATCTTCEMAENFSNYWTAALYFKHPTNGSYHRVPGGLTVYYTQFDLSQDNIQQQPVKSFQPGFRMTVGSPTTTGAPRIGLRYQCLSSDGGRGQEMPDFPTTPCAGGIFVTQHFPACWDGVNLDSPDHQSHMYNTIQSDGFVNAAACPSSHPVRVPQVAFETVWDTSGLNSMWSSGAPNPYVWSFEGATGVNGPGTHADYMFGWKGDALQRAMNQSECFYDGCGSIQKQQMSAAAECTIPLTITEPTDGWLTELPGVSGM
ncbi:Uu.00g022980.m01.CDS01 [Anthostomella pinea]|uniref:Uu.00g022980.m01.CDS01 n=1 Tax=Anthostomella pinea TaxID=933095 RepID=A0AAI8YQW7_9PEZI|nr:Uu.00g022980.m01.CDS01 [Anthostomella pinea]